MNNPWPNETKGDCDCCGKWSDKLAKVYYSNIETWACPLCRGISDPEYEYEDRE